MTENRWTTYDSIQSHLTTELNALANNANKLGAAINFATSGTNYNIACQISTSGGRTPERSITIRCRER